jgi:hypothetical protein
MQPCHCVLSCLLAIKLYWGFIAWIGGVSVLQLFKLALNGAGTTQLKTTQPPHPPVGTVSLKSNMIMLIHALLCNWTTCSRRTGLDRICVGCFTNSQAMRAIRTIFYNWEINYWCLLQGVSSISQELAGAYLSFCSALRALVVYTKCGLYVR